jgi:hypothetical protein
MLDINGIAVPIVSINPTAATSGFLFTYSGAARAYSVRQLNNNADQIMRVRRASDNVEADVGFDVSNELSLTSPISNTSDAQSYTDLADFVDHTGTPTDAFCRYWYDQTGAQKHARQCTATKQPQIYDSATGLIEEGSVGNEKPALTSSGNSSNGYMEINNSGWNINNLACFAVGVNTSVSSRPFVSLGAFADGSAWYQGWTQLIYYGTGTVSGSSITTASQTLISMTASTGQSTVYVRQDGAADSSRPTINATVGSTTVGLGHLGGSFTDANSKWQEVIIWTNDQYNNIGNIESDQNTFFSIY